MAAQTQLAPSRWHVPDLPVATAGISAVDRETMVSADRIATDRVGLGLLQMMESAGRELAELTRAAPGGSAMSRKVLVLAGTGNNAGGGLVAARRLAGWGAEVCVADRSYADLAGEAMHSEAVIDALIGYSLQGAPDDDYRPLIAMAPLGDGPVISLDLASGIDASTGGKPGDAVIADMTLALALPKRGTEIGVGRRSAGVRYLADIGIPASVFVELGIEALPDFADGPLLRLY